MLIEEKIKLFKEALEHKYDERVENYADKLKGELHFYFFDLKNDTEFVFLNQYYSKNDIFNRVNFIISKIIMLEGEGGYIEIFYEYF